LLASLGFGSWGRRCGGLRHGHRCHWRRGPCLRRGFPLRLRAPALALHGRGSFADDRDGVPGVKAIRSVSPSGATRVSSSRPASRSLAIGLALRTIWSPSKPSSWMMSPIARSFTARVSCIRGSVSDSSYRPRGRGYITDL
jgi:hypothetical protein